MKNKYKSVGYFLREGNVIAIPTETVYGFAVDATLDNAVKALFQIKERPLTNPVQIMVKDIGMALDYVEMSKKAQLVAKHFWPGPLSMVCRKREKESGILSISSLVNVNDATLSIRIPDNRAVLELLEAYGCPLAVSSANKSGFSPCKTLNEIKQQFGDDVTLLNDQSCGSGVASTVIDMSKPEGVSILRQGAISLDDIKKIASI